MSRTSRRLISTFAVALTVPTLWETSALAAQAPGGSAPSAVGSPTAAADRDALRAGERTFDDGTLFGTVTLYAPSERPKSVVIFLSGDGGWNLGVVDMARHLRDAGAAVAGVDVRHYLAAIGASKGSGCRYMAADLETLAHRVERELGLRDYQQPLLYGFSSGAAVVYAVLVQSPPGTFAGAVSIGFCPSQQFGGVALCPGSGPTLHYHAGEKGEWVLEPAPKLTERWLAFQGQIDEVCPAATVDQFAASVGDAQVERLPGVGHGFGIEKDWVPQFLQLFAQLSAESNPPPVRAPDVADLPLIEQPASGAPSAPLALLLTGDGGWAGLDRGVAHALNQRGVPVVALSTLKYYWHVRTPEESAADVERVLRHYLLNWQRSRVLLIGYSFGADVMPFIVNRLPADLRARIVSVSLLGLSEDASFVIHVAGWVPGSATGSAPVRPELQRMQGIRALCLYGDGEQDDPCPRLGGPGLRAQAVGQGHHFGAQYAELSAAILDYAGVEIAAAPETGPTVAPQSEGR